jgi:hypothetical protein
LQGNLEIQSVHKVREDGEVVRKRGRKRTKDVSSSEEDEEDNAESELEEGSVEIRDCIVVRPQ